MAFDGLTWNEVLPDDNVAANQIDDYDVDLRKGIRSRMAKEHMWPASQTATSEAGHHNYISLQPQAAAPTLVAASSQAGAVYLGSSASGYPLLFENSAGTAFTIIGSGNKVAAITGGTFGSIVICSSANPLTAITLAGSADGLPLITHAATAAPTWAAVGAIGVSSIFGTQVDMSASYATQAATSDGFVLTVGRGGGAGGTITGHIGPTSALGTTPFTVSLNIDYYGGFTMPVKKGEYWDVTVGGATVQSVYWRPVGV